MDADRIAALLEQVRSGALPVAEALERLRDLPYEDLGFAKIDHHRALRQGVPEVVLAAGKTAEQVEAIVVRLAAAGSSLLVTRLPPETAAALRLAVPDLRYSPVGRIAWTERRGRHRPIGSVLVIAAGTADLPVAEEAACTAAALGARVERLVDVGVAGLHRLFDARETVRAADVVIVVAGMEGALPSVVGGWIDQPVIAVPTSIGYGTSFGGLAALLGMLNSCANGVVVVNVDNGFGAAMAAGRWLRRRAVAAPAKPARRKRA